MDKLEALLLLESTGRLPSEQQNALNLLRSTGRVPPLAGQSPATVATPATVEAPGFSDSTLLGSIGNLTGRVGQGLLDIPGALGGFVSNMGSAYKNLTIGSPEQQPKTLAEADKFYKNRSAIPNLVGSAEGLITGAGAGIPRQFLPETTDPDRLAARTLTEPIGAIAPFSALAKGAGALGLTGKLTKFVGIPTLQTAVEPLARGDVGGALQSGTTAAGIGAATLGVGRVTRAGAKYFNETLPAIREAKAAGGATGIINDWLDNLAQTTNEAGVSAPIKPEVGGKIIDDLTKSGRAAAQKLSDANYDKVRAMVSDDAALSNPESAGFAQLVADTDPAVQTTGQKKVAALGDRLIPKEQTPKTEKFSGINLAMVDPARRAGIIEAMKLKTNPLTGATEPVTFKRLMQMDQDLNAIEAIDRPTKAALVEAHKIVIRDMEKLAPSTPGMPDPVLEFKKAQLFHADEVGTRYGPESKLGEMTKSKFKTPELNGEERLAAHGALKEADILKTYADMEKYNGPGSTETIKKAHLQRLINKTTDHNGNIDATKILKEIAANPEKSDVTRQWRALIGDENFQQVQKMTDAVRSTGFRGDKQPDIPGGPVSVWSGFHTARGFLMLATGNTQAATYHFATAALMNKLPGIMDRTAGNRVGAKLLSEGMRIKPGTPAGNAYEGRVQSFVDQMARHDAFMDRNPTSEQPMIKYAAPGRYDLPRTPGTPTPEQSIAADQTTAMARAQVDANARRAAAGDVNTGDITLEATGPAARSAAAIENELAKAQSPAQALMLRKQLQSLQDAGVTDLPAMVKKAIPTGEIPAMRDFKVTGETVPSTAAPDVRAIGQGIKNRIVEAIGDAGKPLTTDEYGALLKFKDSPETHPAIQRMIKAGLERYIAKGRDVPPPPADYVPPTRTAEAIPENWEPPPTPFTNGAAQPRRGQQVLPKAPRNGTVLPDSERTIGGLLDRETAGSKNYPGFGKYLISRAEMREMQTNLGKDAAKWFTTDTGASRVQPIENLIDLLHENNFISSASYDEMVRALVDRTGRKR